MKYLVFCATPLSIHEFLIQLNEAIKLFNEGHEVIFAYGDNAIKAGRINPRANALVLAWSKYIAKKGLKKLPKQIKTVPLTADEISQKSLNNSPFVFDSLSELKNLNYKGVKIGWAVLSTFITSTRNSEPNFSDKDTKKYFLFLLNDCANLVDSAEELIKKEKPDEIVLFNGRLYENRPFMDLAIENKIPFTCMEYLGSHEVEGNPSITRYVNSMPHDIKNHKERCLAVWENSSLPEEEKIKIGRSFFEKRRAGEVAGDKAYTKNQKQGALPENIDINKTNIVIFNSSEDEFMSLGEDFASHSLFNSQYEGIRYMLQNFENNSNYHFYIRVHPNLSNVKYKYHLNLYDLENEFPNVTVIPADEIISTYALMDLADKVVVFGSTMGIESVYWNKPVILLSGCSYYYLDCCYIPKEKPELLSLMKEVLFPKENTNAIKFGFYLLNRTVFAEKPKYISTKMQEIKIKNIKLRVFEAFRILNSPVLFAFCNLLFYKIGITLFKNRVLAGGKVIEENKKYYKHYK